MIVEGCVKSNREMMISVCVCVCVCVCVKSDMQRRCLKGV
jgi:hypothetical protein